MTAEATPAQGVPFGDVEVRAALDVAETLIRSGVPVFAAEPALTPDGAWDPTGGHGGCGYWLPANWEKTFPSMNVLADPGHTWVGKTWRPGMALCAVMGHVCDGLDVDPRNGGLEGVTSLPLVEGITGLQRTPSGGYHRLIAPLRTGSKDGAATGVDIKGGTTEGAGRGFLFIAPTVRLNKETGEVTPYRWEEAPDLASLPSDASDSELAAHVRSVKGPRKSKARETAPDAPQPRGEEAPSRLAEASTVELRVLGHAADLATMPLWVTDAATRCFVAGTKVGQYVRAGQVDADWAQRVLHSAVDGWTWKRRGDRERILNEIDKGLRKGYGEDRPWTEDEPAPPVTVLTEPLAEPEVEPGGGSIAEPEASPFVQPGADPAPGMTATNADVAGQGGDTGNPSPSVDLIEFARLREHEALMTEVDRLRRQRKAREILDAEERAAISQEAVTRMAAEMLGSAGLDGIPDLPALIEGWIFFDSLFRIVGPSGSFKSFIGLDWLCRVATGRHWFGYGVTQGPVIYVIGEGARGVRKRVRAWELQYNDGRPIEGLHLMPRPVQLAGQEWPAFVEVCRRIEPAMILLDTQARMTVGINEQDAGENGEAIDQAEALRRATGAAVGLVHHTGKTGEDGRGSSAWIGAMQTEIYIKRLDEQQVQIKAAKQKDDEELGPYVFKLTPVGDSLIVTNLEPIDLERQSTKAIDASLAETLFQGRDAKVSVATVVHGLFNGGSGGTKSEIRTAVEEAYRMARGEAMPKSTWYAAWNEMDKAGWLATASSKTRFVLSDEACLALGLPIVDRVEMSLLGGNMTSPGESRIALNDHSPGLHTNRTPGLPGKVLDSLPPAVFQEIPEAIPGRPGTPGMGGGVRSTPPSPGVDRGAEVQESKTKPEPPTDVPAADPVVDPEKPVTPACPCGRSTHSSGNWVTCPEGHRYHGVGFGALDDCPDCGDLS